MWPKIFQGKTAFLSNLSHRRPRLYETVLFGMYFIEGSNFNWGQKYFSGGQKILYAGVKFYWGSEIL
jgi:hypothetical protein